MKRFFLSLIALLLPALALGAGSTANLSWTIPTTYTDGSAMPASDVAFYTITYTFASVPQTVKISAPALATTVSSLLCGSTAFSITLTTTATAVYPNATSAPNGPVPYATGISCVPNSPGNFKATKYAYPQYRALPNAT